MKKKYIDNNRDFMLKLNSTMTKKSYLIGREKNSIIWRKIIIYRIPQVFFSNGVVFLDKILIRHKTVPLS